MMLKSFKSLRKSSGTFSSQGGTLHKVIYTLKGVIPEWEVLLRQDHLRRAIRNRRH